ncbi:hypothetical protein [Yoonia sp. 2307UL14-13]|uniref:hypothetical protein n=1 Tax=Yoonia sp. 2307UL14-13 TaxID=3126506 RepID=UPI0030ACB16E
MNDRRKTLALAKLMEVSFQAAQADMAKLNGEEAQLRQRMRDLTDEVSRRATAMRPIDEPATIAGADLRWHCWIDQRKAKINAELARVLARQETCRIRLSKSFGKRQIAAAIAAKSDSAARKPDYES